MAYYITINNKKNRHLDITSLEEFQKLSKYKEGAYSLEEIDEFTSKFSNEIELKRKLFERGLISRDELNQKIEIRMKLNGKLEKVRHGLVYSNIKKYLDIQYLTSKLLILSNDKEFINKLLDHHRGNYKQEGLRQINAIVNGYNGPDLNMSKAIYQFVQDEIFKTDRETGLVTIKYKSLHDLAMFVYNYIQAKEPIKPDDRIKELNNIKNELLSIQSHQHKITVKRKVKQPKIQLEGQLSFF